MEKSQKEKIEEFYGSLFSDALKEYLDAKDVKIVRPNQNFLEHQRPDVLYEILYKSNAKDRIWAEITVVYPDNKAAKHVNQAAMSGQRGTPEQQEALKDALRGSSDKNGVNLDHQTVGNWVEIPREGDMPRQQEFLYAALKGTPVLDADPKMACICNRSISKKMQKESYGHLCEKYGKGHLLVIIPYQAYPLVSNNTVEHVKKSLAPDLLKQQCNFDSLWMVHKQPEMNNLFIYHDPNSVSLRYAFYSLWPECN